MGKQEEQGDKPKASTPRRGTKKPVPYVPSADQRRAAVLHGLSYEEYLALHPNEKDAKQIIALGSCPDQH